MVPVRAEVASLDDLSAHADYAEILDWLGHMRNPPIATFVTHGGGAGAADPRTPGLALPGSRIGNRYRSEDRPP